MSGGGGLGRVLGESPLSLLASWKALGVLQPWGPPGPEKRLGIHVPGHFVTVACFQPTLSSPSLPPPSSQQYVQGSFSSLGLLPPGAQGAGHCEVTAQGWPDR